jgi:nitroimidazol reductase NimA-like FMN-containing flavoprotein (pyridoxamine 5'-phosphate oxidase superfamily)
VSAWSRLPCTEPLDAENDGTIVEMAMPSELVELNKQECLELLAAVPVGRVIFTDRAMPAAQPVNYLLDGEEILFRTANGSKLAAATRHAVVGFQVDEIDPRTRTGWSVLGVGEANEVVHPGRLAELAELLSDPWVDDHDGHTISISLQIISGRRLERSAPKHGGARAPSAAEPGRR